MTMNWWDYPITQGFGPTTEKSDSSYGGYANFNKGLDYGVPPGTSIGAIVGGTVISVGDTGDGWGIRVWIRDAQGNVHNYGHLNSASAKVGQTVTPGTDIGMSGNTGKSTGPHLSYDVWKEATGEYFDPSGFTGNGSAAGYESRPTGGTTMQDLDENGFPRGGVTSNVVQNLSDLPPGTRIVGGNLAEWTDPATGVLYSWQYNSAPGVDAEGNFRSVGWVPRGFHPVGRKLPSASTPGAELYWNE